MDVVGEKWKRMAKELFDLFSKTMAESGLTVKEVVHPIFHPKNVQEMTKMGVSRTDIEDMIVFSVKNWDRIKNAHLKSLAHEPCFNQMLSHFKYPTLIHLSKTGLAEPEKSQTAEPSPDGLSPEARAMVEKWTKRST